MKKLTVAVICALGILAQAHSFTLRKEVICGDAQAMLRSVTGEKYKELPIWIGDDDDSETRFVVLINSETNTWTILQYNKSTACILGTGDGFKINTENIRKSKIGFAR